MNGHTAVVKMLLAAGARADAADSTALLYAAGPRGSPDMVRALLEAPAHAAHADAQHSQALRAAAIGGRFNACRLLLSARQHPARLEHCWGVIHEAAARGHHRVLALLQDAAQRCGLNYLHSHHGHHHHHGHTGVHSGCAMPAHLPVGAHMGGMGPGAQQPAFVPSPYLQQQMGGAVAVAAAGGGGGGAAGDAAAAAFLTGPPFM